MDSVGLNMSNDPPETNEIKDTLDNLKCKNTELNKFIKYLKTENVEYKKKYNDLKRKLTKLNSLLEKNAQVFHQLFDDTRSALQMGRIPMLESPVRKKLSLPGIKNGPSSSTVASTAVSLPTSQIRNIVHRTAVSLPTSQIRNIVHRKIPIEPITMSELQTENQEEEISDHASLRNELSTILEESFHSDSRMKELCVKLNRLPSDLIVKHLREQNDVLANSFNIMDSYAPDSGPDFSSTPLKFEAMRNLGLLPINTLNTSDVFSNFVSTRKRNKENKNDKTTNDNLVKRRRERSVSPKNMKNRNTANDNLDLWHKETSVSDESANDSLVLSQRKILASPKNKKNGKITNNLVLGGREKSVSSKNKKSSKTTNDNLDKRRRDRSVSHKNKKDRNTTNDDLDLAHRKRSVSLERENVLRRREISISPKNKKNVNNNLVLGHREKSVSPKNNKNGKPANNIDLRRRKISVSPESGDGLGSRLKRRLVSPKIENFASPKKLISPKKERISDVSRKRIKSSPQPPFVNKRKKLIREVEQENVRPMRKAKPKTLKEESLKTKKRRS